MFLLGACGSTSGGGPESGAPTGVPAPGYATIRLTWDPHTGNIAGYYVYHGTAPGAHPDKVWAGKATSFDYRVFARGDHYFAVSAIDQYGNESRKSEEIHLAVP